MGGLAPICSSPGTLTRLKEEGRKLPTEVGGRWHLGSLGRPPRPTIAVGRLPGGPNRLQVRETNLVKIGGN